MARSKTGTEVNPDNNFGARSQFWDDFQSKANAVPGASSIQSRPPQQVTPIASDTGEFFGPSELRGPDNPEAPFEIQPVGPGQGNWLDEDGNTRNAEGAIISVPGFGPEQGIYEGGQAPAGTFGDKPTFVDETTGAEITLPTKKLQGGMTQDDFRTALGIDEEALKAEGFTDKQIARIRKAGETGKPQPIIDAAKERVPEQARLPDFTARGRKSFEQNVFNGMGGNPYAINVADEVEKSSALYPKLFDAVFGKGILWRDRGRLNKEEERRWEDAQKAFRAQSSKRIEENKEVKIKAVERAMAQWDRKSKEFQELMKRRVTAAAAEKKSTAKEEAAMKSEESKKELKQTQTVPQAHKSLEKSLVTRNGITGETPKWHIARFNHAKTMLESMRQKHPDADLSTLNTKIRGALEHVEKVLKENKAKKGADIKKLDEDFRSTYGYVPEDR